jgi:MFS family permease
MTRLGRFDALVLLTVFGVGVFLAGLELMITAVALPAIVVDLADWTRLREASWIVNGYLLAYVVTMPLAGRLADVWGARRLFLGGLLVFIVGSVLAGRAQSMEELVAGRVVQAIGGGVLVPVATAAASHLFDGVARPRALGVVGALTFLGMAAGPFAGAAILGAFHPEALLGRLGMPVDSQMGDAIAPAWRWVFYINVPFGILALILAWAAGGGWETERRRGRIDFVGAILFSVTLIGALGALTLLGSMDPVLGIAPGTLMLILGAIAVAGTLLVIVRGLRTTDPFLDPRLFGRLAFASAAIVSLLTGYALATAIVGGAVFVDRVLYGGPNEQRLVLGALAAATALGALVSGFAVRVVPLAIVTLVGLGGAALGLFQMASWTPRTEVTEAAAWLAVFGFGFGLTVTPRSTAAVESAGRSAFGVASATVTVARMVGMAVGLAILTAYGSTTIDRLYDQVFATPDGYLQYIPEELRDRSFRDALVVDALERWAAGEAARIMVGIVGVAAVLTLVAVPPALVLDRGRRRMLPRERGEGSATRQRRADGGGGTRDDELESPSVAL